MTRQFLYGKHTTNRVKMGALNRVAKVTFLRSWRRFHTLNRLSVQLKDDGTQRTQEQPNTTHFGYQTVTKEEKASKVYGVFENVSDNYDLMNDAMSMGIHRLWKHHFLMRLAPSKGCHLLDVAGGTGDIAFKFLHYIKTLDKVKGRGNVRKTEGNFQTEDGERQSKVVVCDINQSMLEVGQRRAEKLGHKGVSWVQGDAMDLPIKDETFDAYTIAFGIRNVVDIDKALSEAYRVLKPGGRFMCLEFSHVPNAGLRWYVQNIQISSKTFFKYK